MKKFWDDPYVFTFEAEVREIIHEEKRLGLIFPETYFYPEGGGQPSDRGLIASFPVLDVQETEEAIVHYIARTPQSEAFFAKGMVVPCQIDGEFRLHNMRIHTACHLLFGAARKMFSEVEYAGFNIGEVGSLYLETPRLIRVDDLPEMTRLVNEVVVEDRPVISYFLEREAAQNLKELSYNIELPAGKVRIIEIKGWDTAACSGTHVHSTVAIGPIKVIAREIHKKGVTRVNYAVGKRAVMEMANDEKTLLETAELLNTSKDQVPQIVQKIAADLQSSQRDLRKMRERLMGSLLQELQDKGESVGGVTLIVDAVEYLDAASVRQMVAKLLSGKSATVVALIGGTADLSLAAGCTADLNLALAQPIVALAKKYGGGGGGKPDFVTAGGIQFSAPALLQEVRAELLKLLSRA
jgi:alanyl-tRNA synthetase